MRITNRLRLNSAGFTLAELTIAMAIFSFVLVIMTAALVQLYRIYDSGQQIRDTQESVRTVSEDITNDAHDALSIVVAPDPTYPAHSLICLYTTYQQTSSTLIGVEYFVQPDPLNANASAVTEVPVTYNGTIPATTCRVPVNPLRGQIITGDEVTVKGFAASVNPAPVATNSQVLTLNLSIASVAGQNLLQPDPKNPGLFQCPGGPGSEYCSLTNLRMSALNQVGSSS
jgi:prepilin-type N-terminal cleavage/methylation domain-containing protein